MAQIFDIEEKEGELPILCIFGFDSLLHEFIVRENTNKFRIILVSDKRPELLEEFPQIYFIPYQKGGLLPKMEESIRYSIVFLTEKNASHIEPFIEKFKTDQTRALIISKTDEIENIAIHFAKLRQNNNFRFALMGEVLTRKKGEPKGNLSKIIENAILNGEMKVNGEENIPVFGITMQDALLGIGRILFGNFKSGTIYYLFYEHPQSLLETVHLVGRVEPEAKIIFSNTTTSNNQPTRQKIEEISGSRLQMGGAYLDSSLVGFEKGVELLFNEKAEVEPTRRKRKKLRFFKKLERIEEPVRFTFISILLGSVLFLIVNIAFLGVGLLFLKSASDSIQNNDFAKAARNAKVAHYFLATVKPTISLTFDFIDIFDKNGNIQTTYSLLLRGRELIEIAGTTINSLTGEKVINENSLTVAMSNLSFLYQEGQRVALEKPNKKLSEQLKQTYAKMLSFSSVLPEILGFDGQKHYLLLFQNDEELRPTGGFIGSIGDLKVENGKITDLKIQDVYELDGQLKNHIEPPFIVRRYLQPHLYLRDSNFYLDFQEAASTSAKIYNLESGQKPDAVIAIDLQVLREIMKASGPINLPSYNVTVSDSTVSQFIQNTIKDNFFPGSTQKKDILNSLFHQLVEKSNRDSKFNTKLLKLLPELLEKKNILVSFSDNSIQKIFSANRYAGEYNDFRPKDSKVAQDFLYINEGNFGVNKVNAAVSREVLYTAILGDGIIDSKATLKLTNNSPTDNYTSYLSFVVPAKSRLKQVKINNAVQPLTTAITDPIVYEAEDFVKPEGLEVEQYERGAFSYFSFIVNANLGETTTIDVEYENGTKMPLESITGYSLLFVKQPGTLPFKVVTTLNYPESYIPFETKAESYGKNFMETTHTADKDFIYEARLKKGK